MVALLIIQSFAQRTRPSPYSTPGIDASFDYVVVGGGTAGLALATRLAEDQSITVAVVEAGGFYEEDNSDINVIPGQASYYSGWDLNDTQPLIDWCFVTEPQAASSQCSQDARMLKILTGSSLSTNALRTWQDIGRFFGTKLSLLPSVNRIPGQIAV